ncbi:NAD-dependent DNA ligase LigA [Buchnera aphidicola (Taiwanaphis decaspermi)]|uniref:NAD-dependent DNA ligase LigA n=1 Tax=Buchnera aphidicola TaxID=9 RepID=UPI0031B7F431
MILKINYHNYLYYSINDPEITDYQYDLLINKLKYLEKKNPNLKQKNSPTKNIGNGIFFKKKTYKHLSPMFSLNNIFTYKEYLKFVIKTKKKIKKNKKKIELICELKIDGVAINLIYKEGVLIKALTRGNGISGEDVTKNIYNIKSIPKEINHEKIPKKIEVRGEIFINKKNFKYINKKLLTNKHKVFSSARNAASGSILQKNPKVTYQRKLMFLCHGYGYWENKKKPKSYLNAMMKLKSWGFPVDKNICLYKNDKNIYSYYNKIKKKRKKIKFDIDGIVIKINSTKLQNKIGYTSKFPKWAIAFKFPAEKCVTKVKYVKFQVGRTGVITPVAYLKTCYIANIKIKKVSLYNLNKISKLNLYINDIVIIKRSCDVIPKITKVIKSNNKNKKKIKIPIYCPSCKSILKYSYKKTTYRCYASLICKDQIKKSLNHFVSKNAFNINNFGPKLSNFLIDNNYIKDFSDIFNLNTYILEKNSFISHKKSKKIINSIKNSKKILLYKFIYSLGIRNIGTINSLNISNYFNNINKIINVSLKDLYKIKNIGIKTANRFYRFIYNKKNRLIIKKLISMIKIIYYKYDKKNYFYNKKVSITGIFENYTRKYLKNFLIKSKGIFTNNVSKNTDVLLVGKKFGSKFYIAKKLNVNIIKENKLKKILIQ